MRKQIKTLDTRPRRQYVGIMKTILCSLYAVGVLLSQLLCMGCQQTPPATSGCQYTFTPDTTLETETLAAAAAWQEATGLNICIAPGGVPIHSVSQTQDGNEDSVCGITTIEYRGNTERRVQYIEIATDRTDCHTLYHTVLHEMGHALSRARLDDPGHAPRGVMFEKSIDDDNLDADAIDYVCRRAPCEEP